MKLCRLKAFTPMPACRYRQEQRATRSRLARRSFTTKLPGQPAPGVRARAALARRLALISRSALGFGRRKPSEHHEYHRKRGTAATGTMPSLGGIALSDNDVAAVAAYVWAIAQG